MNTKERLAARQAYRQRVLYSAAAQLLATDLPELAPVVLEPVGAVSPLVMAMQAAAAQLGVSARQITLPAGLQPDRQDFTALKRIAAQAGMGIRRVSLDTGWQLQDNGPLIGFLGKEQRPVALLPVSPSQYRLYDPAAGFAPITEELLNKLEPTAYVLYAGLTGKTVGMGEWLKFMLTKCWSGDIYTILLASLAAGIIPILMPFVTQTIFDDIIPIGDKQAHIMVVQVMLVSAFATAGVAFTRAVAVMRAKNKSRLTAEAALWLRLLSLPAAFFRKFTAGDLAQRMNGVNQMAALLSSSAVSAVFNTLFSFWSLLVMLYYSWQLTLAAGLVWLVYFIIAVLLSWRIVVNKRRVTVAAGRSAGTVLQLFNGLTKFRNQGAEAQAFLMWAKPFGEQWKWNRATRKKSNWLEIINTVQPVLLSMLMFWLTMHWLEASSKEQAVFITQPEFLGFQTALAGFNAAVTGLVPVVANLLDIIPQAERIRPILAAEPEVTSDKAEPGELTGQLEITNVCFRYGHDKPQVLSGVTLTIEPGQFVAIVGGSGSGKSTLLRLLLGFDQPESGSIYYDAQDLAELNVAAVRAQLGVVLQNGQLIAGDIFTNIVGSLPLTPEAAWEAAAMAGLAEDIKAMPMGMNTVISEGSSNISGGQRQRILIARAIVKRPAIIIFDEATSALDNHTQAIVTASLDNLKATRIVVAHRLSTIQKADVIHVLDKGRIVESGSYEQLMAQGGLFAALARRQMA